MRPAPPSSIGTYVYCVAHAAPFAPGSPPLQAWGIGMPDAAVRTLQFADLAAVVSDAPRIRYDISRENMMAHQLVIEEAMRRSDVLPVRFGTVASGDQEVLEKLLKREFHRLHREFQDIENHVELGLKVFWNREQLFADIVAENVEIRALRDRIAGAPPPAARYERIQLGELTEAAINLKRDQEAERIVEALRPLAAKTRVNKTIGDMMIVNAAFLVDKSKEPAFDASVNALATVAAGRLTFKYVGPVPPYNFVIIIVRWED
jgi:hypothetical protein